MQSSRLCILVLASVTALGVFLWPQGSAEANGCYICKPGSSEACRHYCSYRGEDDWENRQKCQKAGCEIAGTASCPTGGNYKVCYVKYDGIGENDPAGFIAMRFYFLLPEGFYQH